MSYPEQIIVNGETRHRALITSDVGHMSVRVNKLSDDEREYLQTDQTHEIVIACWNDGMIPMIRVVTPEGRDLRVEEDD